MTPARKLTLVLVVLIVAVFALATPPALRDALERGQFYLFTSLFFADLAPRIAGPGAFRFVVQPLVATFLGTRDGVRDARAGREPYLRTLLLRRSERRALLRSALLSISNLILIAILLDAIFQWVIFRRVYPAAALLIGPLLICVPYSVARSLANRGAKIGGTAAPR